MDVAKPVLSASVVSIGDVDVSVLVNVSAVLGVKTSVVCSSVITVVADVEKDVETAAEVDCVVNGFVTMEVNVLTSLTVDGTAVCVAVVKTNVPGVRVVTVSDAAVLSSVGIGGSDDGAEAIWDMSCVCMVNKVLDCCCVLPSDEKAKGTVPVIVLLGICVPVVCLSETKSGEWEVEANTILLGELILSAVTKSMGLVSV